MTSSGDCSVAFALGSFLERLEFRLCQRLPQSKPISAISRACQSLTRRCETSAQPSSDGSIGRPK
jgi:hypothetical protein